MIAFLEDTEFKKLAHVKHAFFMRTGGVSTGYHSSLNCCYKGLDNPENVRENRRRVVHTLGYPFESLITTINNHTPKVAVVDKIWSEAMRPEADAMVTKLPGIILASDSADCPIVLFADNNARVIGLAHAGWKSAKQGIIAATISEMLKLGASTQNISAVIGPCIAQRSYEVSNDFYEDFLRDNSLNAQHFIPAKRLNHYMFDLQAYVFNHLKTEHLKFISALDIDTYSDERFFSCRRAAHQGEPDFGGHFSCIYLTS